jgi:hypothetical protein
MMELRTMKRVTSVSVLTGALLLGAWGGIAGAAGGAANLPTYSDEDCATLTSIEVDDASNGYFGETALNASEAFSDASADIESKPLRTSMRTLASVWKIVGEKKNAIAAAKATARVGNRYGKALGVYTKALTSCSMQSLTATTTTTETSSSDDSTSTESSESSE